MKPQELILNAIFSLKLVCRTNTGELFRVNKDGTKKKIKTYLNGNGYQTVSIQWNGIKKNVRVHQVVFVYANLKTYDTKTKCIDHIDGNKHNNSIQNLRLVSYTENARNKKKWRKLRESERAQIRTMKKDGFTIPMIAEVFDVSHVTIRNTINKTKQKK